ncbi:MAG: glycosyltransferase family 2 protein [Bdellovibrionaceae bacterium]|nr:glycosyltransferase family 2 protein [Pseudobdellovibrionaceae bacterium]
MRPLLICLTPVKNEAWCLDVFLQSTSLWADYIIIADQNSTDESKVIALKYDKVILIENKSTNYNEADRQKILITEARKISGSKILFALDSDEIFSANFQSTKDWLRILSSKPGEVFGFQWANILPDKRHYFLSSLFYPWVFNDDGTDHSNYVREIHSMRIPYPIEADNGIYHVTEFKVLHLAHIFPDRVKSKWIYYQFTERVKGINDNPISAFRSYNYSNVSIYEIPEYWLESYSILDVSLLDKLDLSTSLFWFDLEVINYINQYGFEYFKLLPIWNKPFVEKIKLLQTSSVSSFSVNPLSKVLLFYLEHTQTYYPSIYIKIVDKFLKFIVSFVRFK